MKRFALRTTAALLSLAALGSTASAQSGYLVSWSKSDAAPAADATAAKTERTSSGYMVSMGKTATTERASSGYVITWGKSAE